MQHVRRRAAAVLVLVAAAVVLVAVRPARLGLDLEGGTQIVLEARPPGGERADRDTLDRTLEVLRRRVDQLGVAEPSLQRSGDRRIIVELPGMADPTQAVEVIGRTAQLSFHPVTGYGAASEGEVGLPGEDGQPLRLGPAAVTGTDVRTARARVAGRYAVGWEVDVQFRGSGIGEWQRLTAAAACAPTGDPARRVAIVLDDRVISSPGVSPEVDCRSGIGGGTTVITGDFSADEATNLALLIRAGSLPVPVEVVEHRTVGPTLGKAAIEASVKAAVVGAALTAVYMIAYYRLLGLLAVLALGAYGALSYALLLLVGATLTLPGIAGFVLAVGMAVDANVLVYERIKDEHRAGATTRVAARNGFGRAWTAIADSNATTLLAALLLFFFASGAVRGFGVTLSLGVVVSVFTAVVVTRVLVDVVVGSRLRDRPRLLGLEVGRTLRDWVERRRPSLVRRPGRTLAVSAAAVVLAVAGLATRGLDYGLEFSGGRLVDYGVGGSVDLDAVRTEMAAAGFPRAVVQGSGDGNVTVRTGRLSADEASRLQDAVERAAGDATVVRDEFVGPTIGAELRRKAFLALGLALLAQLIYLAVRFRWTFGVGAVVAMAHDVLLLLGLYAWLGKTLDGVFLAALLTVIGYSINDSVVVFDRIRELRAGRPRVSLWVVANDACLQTVPRTVNTGLGALFILFALWSLGGATLADFALALIVGIVVGTYSSVFTATPVAVWLESGRRGPPPPPFVPLRPRAAPAPVEEDSCLPTT